MRGRVAAGMCVCASVLVSSPFTRRAECASPPIADITPPNTFMVFSIPDASEFGRLFESSPFGRLWQEESVREFAFAALQGMSGSEDPKEDMGKWLDEIGYDREALHWPSGPMGAAAFIEPAEPEEGEPGEDVSATDRTHVLFAADFGENADAVYAAIASVLERAESQKTITLERIEIGTHAVFELRRDLPEPPEPVVDEETGEEMYPEYSEPDDTDMVLEHLFVSRTSGTVVASTSRRAMESALERLGGGENASLADQGEFARATKSLEGAGHATFMLLLDPIREVSEKMRAEPAAGQEYNNYWVDGPLADMAIGLSGAFDPPAADLVGSGALTSISFGLNMNQDEYGSDLRASVLTNGMRGIFRVLAESQGPIVIPASVPADAAGVFALRVPFDKVLSTMRESFEQLPEQERKTAQAQLSLAEGVAGPVLAEMGPDTTIVQSIRRPLSADSGSYVGLIKLRDATPLTTLVTTYGVQAGFQPRDFEGHTIYESALLPVKVALGMTQGQAIIGAPQDVENVLRGVGKAGQARTYPGISGWGAPGDAGAEAIGYHYSDVRQTLELSYWQVKNADQILAKQLDEWEVPEDQREEYLAAAREERPAFMEKLPELDVLLRHFGDTAFLAQAANDGFSFRWVMFHPEPE